MSDDSTALHLTAEPLLALLQGSLLFELPLSDAALMRFI
jgi:hypothetical protein